MQYGQTQDGMPWGLEGLQLSDTDKAFYIQSKTGLNFITEWFSSKAEPYKYDFYISEDESNVIDYNDDDNDNNTTEKIYHPYNGQEFTKKIIQKATTTIDTKTGKYYTPTDRILTDNPTSAVEYCFNKNARDDKNNVASVNWYLPSIDEIEDITVGAYDEFDRVFQNNLYWSSQPAFIQKYWHGTFWVVLGTLRYDGYLYIDNINSARATKVVHDGTRFIPATSGMSNTNQELNLHDLAWQSGSEPTPGTNSNIPIYGEGYQARDKSHRIRCVYRSGLK